MGVTLCEDGGAMMWELAQMTWFRKMSGASYGSVLEGEFEMSEQERVGNC